jgi:hypothetical protein
MFYVYLLLLATQTKFKIGRTNNVHGRIRDLPHLDFDLAGSLCFKLQTDGESKRLEKILHRALAKWRLEFDANNRYPGDTEMFAVECFPRAVELLTHMTDLYDGALPGPLPAPEPTIIVPPKTWFEAQMARVHKRRQEQEEADKRFHLATAVIECGITQLTEMGLDVFERCAKPFPFIAVESSDRELYDRALGILGEMQLPRFSQSRTPCDWSSMISSITAKWDKATQRGTVTAVLSTTIKGDFEGWNQEYLALLELIPRSRTVRVPVDPDDILRKLGTFDE